MASASDAKSLCTRLRRQFTSGVSDRKVPLSAAKMAEMWPGLLDLHVQGSRPGRAVALLDVRHMLSEHVFRVTECNRSSADEPRALHDEELRAIGAWLEMQESSVPVGAAELRATEELRQGGHSGRRAEGSRESWSDGLLPGPSTRAWGSLAMRIGGIFGPGALVS
jgi:hypothetical protein